MHKKTAHRRPQCADWASPLQKKMRRGRFPEGFHAVALLGEGSYGTVYAYRGEDAAEEVAAKHFASDEEHGLTPATLRELAALQALPTHQRIIQLVEIAPGVGGPVLLMPRMDGTLTCLMRPHRGGLPQADALRLHAQLCDGVRFLHEQGIMHRDLKPSNILCDNRHAPAVCRLRIADMGLSLRYTPGRCNSLAAVSLWWRAPEILLGDQQYDGAVDYWSVGVVLLEMLIGRHACMPFYAQTEDGAETARARRAQLACIFALRGTPAPASKLAARFARLWDSSEHGAGGCRRRCTSC